MGDGGGEGGRGDDEMEKSSRGHLSQWGNLWAAFFQPALWPTDSLAWLTKNYESFRGGLSPCARPGRPHTDPVKENLYHMERTWRIILNLLSLWMVVSASVGHASSDIQVMRKKTTHRQESATTCSSLVSQIILLKRHMTRLPLFCNHLSTFEDAVGAEQRAACCKSACMGRFLPLPQVFKLYSKQWCFTHTHTHKHTNTKGSLCVTVCLTHPF